MLTVNISNRNIWIFVIIADSFILRDVFNEMILVSFRIVRCAF